MYLITYQKRNGDVFCRIRNTIPYHTDGGTTSMGWKILDIKYRFKDNFYTLPVCNKLQRQYKSKCNLIRNIKKIFKTYVGVVLFIVILLLYITK